MYLTVFHVGNADNSPVVYNPTLPGTLTWEPSFFGETSCLPGKTEIFDDLWPLQDSFGHLWWTATYLF